MCWVCVIFFACVFVGTSDSTTTFEDPSSSDFCVVCTGRFLGGSQGGLVCPPLVTHNVQRNAPKKIFGGFFYF
jgi:hypothetical protein